MHRLYNHLHLISAQPFLEMADDQSSSDVSCPQTSYFNITTTFATPLNATDLTTQLQGSNNSQSLNPIAWSYIIAGIFTIASGLALLITAFCRIDRKIQQSTPEHFDMAPQPEEPLKDVIGLFIPVLIFYMGILAIEILYQSYIYSVAVCSDASFSVSLVYLKYYEFYETHTCHLAKPMFAQPFRLLKLFITYANHCF